LSEVVRTGPISRRGWAAYSLGEFGRDALEAVPVLIQLIKEANPVDSFERAASAARSLGKIAPDTPAADEAISALQLVLNSQDGIARGSAVEALGEFGKKAAIALPRVDALKDDRDPWVKERVKRALPRIEVADESPISERKGRTSP
jgi:HEAT repeat protein